MKVNIVKPHHIYPLGVHDVTTERGNYLLLTKVAEPVEGEDEPEKKEFKPTKEKKEIDLKKEKVVKPAPKKK
jgi:hypothetical protein